MFASSATELSVHSRSNDYKYSFLMTKFEIAIVFSTFIMLSTESLIIFGLP